MENSIWFAGVILAIIAGLFLIASIIIFFVLDISSLIKDKSGKLEQRQIEEIRRSKSLYSKKSKVNVFEDLEKKAKFKRGNTQALRIKTEVKPTPVVNTDTTVLNKSIKKVNPNFIIEKNIVVVGTNEVIWLVKRK